MFADVYLGYPLDDSFTYRVPGELAVMPGMRVRVNFAGREAIAFVHRVHDTAPTGFEVKDLVEVVDTEPVFDERTIALARYVADQYCGTMGEAMAMALPTGLRENVRPRGGVLRVVADPSALHALTPDQQLVCDAILAGEAAGERLHLIFGITGSGKTEVYMELARRTIAAGRSVIYLVPEISLASPTFDRLARVFGEEMVVYHSGLSPNQRFRNWMRFFRGEARIVVGTRSAAFMPCPALGLVVIDEEHDGSYKEHSTPRYNARRLMAHRVRGENALMVMGSATPGIESLYGCEQGMMRLHRLESRYGNATLPTVEVVAIDTRKPSALLSTPLKLQTKRAVTAGKQALFLLNRRGFSPIVICSTCGWVAECHLCSISLNFHQDGVLRCHYCGYREPVPQYCKKCGADELTMVGAGTQRMEELIMKEFRDFKVFRLDQDSSRRKGTIPDLMARMAAGDVDILVGTQLVAKGFDFHNVILVGVLLADVGLNVPDFRAAERIFALLMQVGGRSGRGDTPGRVIIQTMNPDHSVFEFIRTHDYWSFYRGELPLRRQMGYPPFTRLARLLVRGRHEESVAAAASRLKEALAQALAPAGASVIIMGPAPAPLPRIAGNWRHHIIIKGKNMDQIRAAIRAARQTVTGRDIYLEIDIDPYDLL